MGKTQRGRLFKAEGGVRGVCPVTKRTGVKLLFEHEIDGNKVMISKIGRATLRNQSKKKEG